MVVFKGWGDREPGGYEIAELTAQPGYKAPRPHIHYKHEEFLYGCSDRTGNSAGRRAVGKLALAASACLVVGALVAPAAPVRPESRPDSGVGHLGTGN